ncbi:MAG: hypothetical protein WCP15_03920, partial [bacterium]
ASILKDPKYSKKINKVLMFDPADYSNNMISGTWTGMEEFKATGQLFSDYLKEITTNMKITVIHFSLRNFDENYRKRTKQKEVRIILYIIVD